ncbi:PGF-pre-PGF domain-containing protein [Methanosarcina sp. T3]|uniref:PGF-pre-PGF domain-containing protein n=1 Tax=Methanosarcina sp. T3 TaxID=3439062 RepID=UPI003F851B63
MKLKKFYSIALVSAASMVFLLILVSSPALATSLLLTETRVTTDESAQLYPAIYGDRIVWTDARNGILDEYGNVANLDIYMYDLSTSREIQITTNESNQSMPAIYGDRIVWQDDRNGNLDIYMYDLSTSTETQITFNSSRQYDPAIYGDRIVWTDDRNDKNGINSDIYIYDVSTQEENQITDEPVIQIEPVIYGDRIVWADFRYGQDEGQSCIFMYDLSTSKETQLTDAGSDHLSPAIYGDRIVYCNSEMGIIFMYDLSTRKETQITTNEVANTPAIYGDRIVWWDWRTGNFSDIYMYDLSTSSEVQITTNESEQFSPAIYGDRIVWSDTRNGYPKYDIYMCTLSESEPEPILPTANFRANTTSGNALLSVLFTDLSENATSRSWNFGDGATSIEKNPVHSYSLAGTYTVNLTAINLNGTDSKTTDITVLEPEEEEEEEENEENENEENENENNNLPVVDFTVNKTSGYAPLSVLFTDLSKNATSRSWDVNSDGIEDSKDASFVYTYTSTGTYTVNLTVSNANGTVSKTTPIAVERKSSGGSSSGGGGGGGSPEPARNIETKELSQAYITNGKVVQFDFAKNATCVVYVSFDSKKTAGKTTTIVEQLKNKSSLVSELPEGEVYRSFNVWVGNSGFATEKNIENPVIGFKVEKAWLQDKKIDRTSIILNRYSDEKWEQLPANLSGEDDEFLYFTSDLPGFSSFSITGTAKGLSEENETESGPEQETRLADEELKNLESETGQTSEQGEDAKAPGFGIVYGTICLTAIFLYKRK